MKIYFILLYLIVAETSACSCLFVFNSHALCTFLHNAIYIIFIFLIVVDFPVFIGFSVWLATFLFILHLFEHYIRTCNLIVIGINSNRNLLI